MLVGKDLYAFLTWFPIILMGTGLITGLFRYSKLKKTQHLLTFLIAAALLVELISRSLWQSEMNTFPLFHIYALFEYGLLVSIFAIGFQHKKMVRFYKWSILVICLFGVINALFFQIISEPNTNVVTVTSVVLVTSSIAFFFRAISDMKYPNVEKSALFWISIGVLAYFSGSFVIFTFGDWLKDISVEYSISVWVIHIFLNVIHYLCFNIALWMKPE